MKQPYVYSMPESFLKDKSVPARWRVLAVINGFILNGGCFYGSNEWLMEQLDCSQHTVSTAFTELEELHEIRTERTRRTRKVYKTSRDSNQLLSEIATERAGDSNQLLPNSVSNSVKEIVANATKYTIEEEPTKEKKVTPAMKEVFALFVDNPARATWPTRVHQREAAQVLSDTYDQDTLKKMYTVARKYRNESLCPQISSPADLLEKLPKLERFIKTV